MIRGVSNRVNHVNTGVFGITPGRYSKELEAVIQAAKKAGYLIPPSFQLRLVDIYIKELIVNQIWQKRDFVYLLGYNSYYSNRDRFTTVSATEIINQGLKFSLIDLKKPSRIATLFQTAQSPFYNRAGWQNNTSIAAVGYIDTNFYPATDAIQWTQNNASFCVYVSKDGDQTGVNGENIIGLRDTSVTRRICTLNIRTGANETNGNLNRSNDGGEATFVASGVTEVGGYHSLDRTASNLTTYYKNGASAGTSAQASGTFNGSALSVKMLRTTGGTEWKRSPLGYCCGGASLGATLQKIYYELFTNLRIKLGYQ